MLPTSLALAWPIWRRHRWGLILSLGYLLCAVVTASALPMALLGPKAVSIILVPLMLPLIGMPIFFLTIFSCGSEADVNVRASCFPKNLLLLPVRTGALWGWHVAYGAAAAVFIWLVPAWFILRPWLALYDAEVPLWWPAALAVATQAWFQAVLWLPVGLPGIRILLLAAVVPTEVAVAESCVMGGVSKAILVSALAGAAVVGWLVGYAGVRQGRRGEEPNWDWAVRWLRFLAFWRTGRREPFPSAASAQVWFEWRRVGLALPTMTVVVMPFVLLPLLFGQNDAIPTWRTLLGALGVPVLLAGLAGTTVSGKNAWVKDYYGVSPFTAGLPMSTAAMVGAKLKAAAISTLASWIILLGMMGVALIITGTYSEVPRWWDWALRELSPAQIAIGGFASVALLVLWTWKRMVDSLLLGLTGRKWVIQGTIFVGLALIAGLAAFAGWVANHPDTHETMRRLLPWLVGLCVCCRLALAGLAMRRLLRGNFVHGKTIVRWVIVWLTLAVMFTGIIAWIVPSKLVPLYDIALAVTAMMPLARFAATPLALAWNRHR